jgi:hypothetical protein
MKLWSLVAIPIVIAVSVGVAASLIGDADLVHFYLFENLAVKLAPTLGCFIAMRQFERSDYMFRAWAFAGLNSLLLTVNTAITGLSTNVGAMHGSISQSVIRAVLLTVANIAMVASIWTFARALDVAGLTSLGLRRERRIAMLVAALVACGLAGRALVIHIQEIAAGSISRIGDLASDIGDIIPLILLAPLLYTVLSLRGGRLVWPFLLISLSTLCWLFFDATGMIGWLTSADTATLRILEESFRASACIFLVTAGIAQRLAIRESAGPVAA